jgi:hypothetical protein
MKILSALTSRRPRATALTDHAHETAGADARPPVPGYDGHNEARIIADLPGRSQIELTAIEDYERARLARPDILNKLRYLRGSEPLPGYDALNPEEISTALHDADLDTITATREYERKFQRRQPILDELARIRHRRKSSSKE